MFKVPQKIDGFRRHLAHVPNLEGSFDMLENLGLDVLLDLGPWPFVCCQPHMESNHLLVDEHVWFACKTSLEEPRVCMIGFSL